MAAVNVRIGHADYLVIAELRFIEFGIYARAEGGYHAADLRIAQHLVEPRLFDVQYLAPEGEYRLEMPVAPLLCGAARGIALDYEELALGGILIGAVGKLAGQSGGIQRRLPS